MPGATQLQRHPLDASCIASGLLGNNFGSKDNADWPAAAQDVRGHDGAIRRESVDRGARNVLLTPGLAQAWPFHGA